MPEVGTSNVSTFYPQFFILFLGLSVAYQTSWTDPCEPFYIGRVDIPSYDETFKQYGFNRISQVSTK